MNEFLLCIRASANGIYDLAENTLEDVFDISPTTNEASPVNSTGRCIGFTSSSRLKTKRIDGFDLKNEDFTISFWIKSQTSYFNGGDWCLPIAGYYGNLRFQVAITYGGYINGESLIQIYTVLYNPHVMINDMQWHHLAVTKKENKIRHFIDGKIVLSVDNTNDITLCVGNNYLEIGGAYAERNYGLNGYMDDICIIKGKALWVEDFTPPTRYLTLNKDIYVTADGVYLMTNNVFTKMADDWDLLTEIEKLALFNQVEGEPAVSDLTNLGKFKVVSYTSDAAQLSCVITAVPKDQIVLPKGLIALDSFEGIDKATLTYNVSTDSNCRVLITADLQHYYTYDIIATDWQEVDVTNVATVGSLGVLPAELTNIPRDSWDKMTASKTGIGFAYLLSMASTTDTCQVAQMDLQVDMKGSWNKALYGTDYKYGYPKNTLLRVTLMSDGDYKINYHNGKS